MDSRAPVRHLSKTVCLVTLLLAAEAGAGIDSPGWVSFHFLAEPDAVYQHFDQVPGDQLSYAHARAFFSTDASAYADTGVRIWAGFDLAGPDGGQGRHAMLILDLDLYQPARGIATPLEENAVRAEYLETRNDRILFEGYPLAVEVWIQDVWIDDGDAGAVEGEFECIFMDPSDHTEGSRVLVTGRFGTDTTPYTEKRERDVHTENNTYVESGCESDVYIEDDYDDSGCEGDSQYDDSGCGGSDDYDYSGSSDCESDTYDSGYSDSSSCEGDGYDSYDSSDSSVGGDCEGDEAYAAVLKPPPRRRRPNRLRAVMRMFPEIIGISFIVFMKRRFRATR